MTENQFKIIYERCEQGVKQRIMLLGLLIHKVNGLTKLHRIFLRN